MALTTTRMTDLFIFALPPTPDSDPELNEDLVSGLVEHLEEPIQGKKPQHVQLSPRVLRLTFPSSVRAALVLSDPWMISFQKTHRLEVVLLGLPSTPSPPAHRPLRLAVFDLDSTLIEQEVIDELASTIGAGAAVAAITERAMRGELDFAASLEARVRLLEGVRADVWDALKPRITFARGARELCCGLKRLGVKMAVFSGGFQPIAEWVKGELGLDRAVANQLRESPSTEKFPFAHLTGVLAPGVPIVTAERKRRLLEEFAAEQRVPLSEALCVGDGANDLDMIRAVGDSGGLGIAFKAKEKVQREAPNRLNTSSLVDLLYLTGRNKQEVDALVSGGFNS